MPATHLALPPELESIGLFYSFWWESIDRPCNFDVDAGCVVLDYSGAFLRAIHIAEKGSLEAYGLAHTRQRRRLRRGEPLVELLGDEGVSLELSRIERAAAFLVFVHMVYSPGPHTFRTKVAACGARLSTAPDGDVFCVAEDFEGEGGALVSAVLRRTSVASSGRFGHVAGSNVSKWRFDAVSRCVKMPSSASHRAMAPQLRQLCLNLSRHGPTS